MTFTDRDVTITITVSSNGGVTVQRISSDPMTNPGYSMEGHTGSTGDINIAAGTSTFPPELPPEVPEPPPVGTVGMWDGTEWLPVTVPEGVETGEPDPPQETEDGMTRAERLRQRSLD
jgi:hypothetical protein